MPHAKVLALQLARACGLFRLARHWTRHEARIVCYHGFSYRDEHRFVPQLFMAPATFERRIEVLRRSGLRVVALEELVQRLEQGQAVSGLLVITVDDGWTGFKRFAWPLIQGQNWPCTLYLTTWYADKAWPVLNVLRRYLAWRGVTLPPEGATPADERARLYEAAAGAGVDLSCTDDELFRLSATPDFAPLVEAGLDLQLHTHRHRLPATPAQLTAEIVDNRRHLAAATTAATDHLCYPSGEYDPAQIPQLRMLGVRSATTTELGLVAANADRWQLPRLLDSDHLHEVEFEAELSGLLPTLRRLAGRGPRPRAPSRDTA